MTGRGARRARSWPVLVLLALGALVGTGSAAAAPTVAARTLPAGVVGAQIRPSADDVPVADLTPGRPRSLAADRARAQRALVGAVLTDLNTFYDRELPAQVQTSMTRLAGGYQAVDSSAAALADGSPLCIGTPAQIAGNAYYCPTGDGIVFDTGALVPVLLGHYGPAGLMAAFAHEFGHAVQARIGPTAAERSTHPERYPGLLVEAQGDCYAGAFLAWVVAGSAPHLSMTAAELPDAAGPLLDFADPTGLAVDDPDAHGLAVDRLADVLRGWRGGVGACHRLTRSDLHPALGRTGTVVPGPARFPDDAAVLTAARGSLNSFVAGLPRPGTRSIAGPFAPAAADLAAARPYGQFAVAATLVLAAGRARTGSAAGAACFTGAWTAHVFGSAGPRALGGWVTDPDEALNILRARPGISTAELTGFADGFARGPAGC